MQISKSQARRFLLAYQGLWPPCSFEGKAGIMAYMQRMRCIQYDPLDIVGTNPDLVLQARVAGYRPEMLRELLYQERRLLDGWDKNVSIYPVEDWPYFRRTRAADARLVEERPSQVREILPQVRAAIREYGPMSSLELKEVGEAVQWDWGWPASLARAALESLYFMGELAIHHRVHTRKYYDLVERCLPEELLRVEELNPSEEAYHDWYVQRRIGSVGLLWNRAGEGWLGMGPIKSPQRKAALERLVEQGAMRTVQVEGLSDPFYYRSQDQGFLEQVLQTGEAKLRATALAPLDNLLWDRRLLRELFGFEYTWEVYVPADKRRYGYYVLPVLYGERFIARFEPGRVGKMGPLTIENWWWEAEVNPSQEMKAALVAWMGDFLRFRGDRGLALSAQAVEEAGLGWLGEGFHYVAV
jgi:uncharacterized protein